MRLIDRYLASTLIRTTALVLFVLMVLFAFFSLIDQLGRYRPRRLYRLSRL
ncbi:MAG: hypothetical protein U5P41_03425 [Gammaproteobacteria bacterium]|nr:hypothetical protein [Gammaproteobacteria bacterium]